MALSQSQIMSLMNNQTMRTIAQQKAQAQVRAQEKQRQDSLAQDKLMLDSLGKWGGGFMEDFRSNNPTFDKLMRFYKGEGPVQMNGEWLRKPEENPFGFDAGGQGPHISYFDIIDAYQKEGKFNPLPAFQMMKDFNQKYGLGLSNEQMAQGIDTFGKHHKDRWGVGFGPSSNNLAIAMSSLSAGAGKQDDYSTSEGMKRMWAEHSPNLASWDQKALEYGKSIAESFDKSVMARKPVITEYVDKYLDAVDKQIDAKDKAFLKGMGSFALSAFTPGLGSFFTPSLGAIGGNALAGGITGGLGAAITGSDIGKGLLGGAVSGGIGGYANGIGGDKFLGVGMKDVVKAGGNVAGGLIQGKDPSKLIQGAAGSLVGTGAGNLAGGFLKDSGLSNQMAGLGGKFVGSVANSLVRGNDLQSALASAGIGAGAGLLGGAVGSEFGKGAGEMAGSLVSGTLGTMLQQKQMQDRMKQAMQSRPSQQQQMQAAWQKMTPQQRAAIVARVRKG